MAVPAGSADVMRAIHNETVTPSAATPPGEFVFSATFVQVFPDASVTLTTSLWSPSVVERLSEDETRRATSPGSAFVRAVVNT